MGAARRGSRGVDAGGPALFGADAPGAVVTALRPSPRDPSLIGVIVGRRRVGAVDAREVEALGLRAGGAWTGELAARVGAASERAKAHRFMLRSLGARAQSRGMALDRLRRKGVEAGVAEEVVRGLEAAGLLNDEEFAQAYARSALARGPIGARRLEQALASRRVERGLAKKTAAEALAGRDASEDALALAQRRVRALPARLDERAKSRRVYAYLARRGFDADVCARAVRAALGTGSSGRDRG